MKNKKGFISIFMLAAAPLLLTLFFVSLQFFIVIKQKSYILKTCRESVLNSQNILLSGMEKLFKLNAEAKDIIKKKKFLKASRLIPHPISVARYQIMMAYYIGLQIKLSIQQQTIITSTNSLAKAELAHFQTNLNPKELSTWQTHTSLKINSKANTPKLKISKTHPKEIASPYKESLNFSSSQLTALNINYKTADLLFKDFNKIIPNSILIKERCESLPSKNVNKWVARLN